MALFWYSNWYQNQNQIKWKLDHVLGQCWHFYDIETNIEIKIKSNLIWFFQIMSLVSVGIVLISLACMCINTFPSMAVASMIMFFVYLFLVIFLFLCASTPSAPWRYASILNFLQLHLMIKKSFFFGWNDKDNFNDDLFFQKRWWTARTSPQIIQDLHLLRSNSHITSFHLFLIYQD